MVKLIFSGSRRSVNVGFCAGLWPGGQRTIARRVIIVYFYGMSFFGRISLVILTAAFLAAANGCSPGDAGHADDEKEPHFLLGNSRCNEMDWPGAVEAFSESLEVNPHSAQAHYRLALLYDTKVPDPAAAIYHYQEYLKLDADAPNREIVTGRIDSCKQQLATDVLQLPSAPAVQKQLDSLVDQNRQLQGQIDKLTAQLKDWNAYYQSLKQAGIIGNTGSPLQPVATATPTTSTSPDDISDQQPPARQAQSQPPQTKPQTKPVVTSTTKPASVRASRFRTHIVASGETMASIARKHGLTIAALEDANPSINPKKLHVGQLVNLP